MFLFCPYNYAKHISLFCFWSMEIIFNKIFSSFRFFFWKYCHDKWKFFFHFFLCIFLFYTLPFPSSFLMVKKGYRRFLHVLFFIFGFISKIFAVLWFLTWNYKLTKILEVKIKQFLIFLYFFCYFETNFIVPSFRPENEVDEIFRSASIFFKENRSALPLRLKKPIIITQLVKLWRKDKKYLTNTFYSRQRITCTANQIGHTFYFFIGLLLLLLCQRILFTLTFL